MHLTKQEERMLDGECGWANRVAMKILVRLGDLFGGTRLVPIQSAHLSGVSYKHLGDAAIDFLNEVANKGGKAQTLATLNPSSFDPEYLVHRHSKERFDRQQRIIEVYEKMLIKPTLTCTPYYLQEPKPGQHLAWSESSAVVYANSVLGAWTNREGSPSALAAALVGKTPNYGLHQAENRRPNVLVKVETPLKSETEYGALGIYLGKLLKDKIPVFEGLADCSSDELKQLGAGMASSGMTAMFYRKPVEGAKRLEKLSIEARDVKESIASLCTSSRAPDMIFIGCPHCSPAEVKNAARLLREKRVRRGVEFWVCTSRHVRGRAREHVKSIERAGGHVLCDTCALVTWIKDLKVNTLMTNSAKTAYYAPFLNEVEVTLAPLSQCIRTACEK